MRRSRRPTAEELALWHQIARGFQPLRPAEVVPVPAPPAIGPPPEPPRVPAAAMPEPKARAAPAPPGPRRLDPSRPVDMDRRSWLKLRRGLYPIDARLDLHGMTQEQAHQRLEAFLRGAASRGSRCILVITGRGLRHGGTLRTMTPRWLEEGGLRGLVLSYAQARLEHGGDGALYVLLRRRG